MTNKVRSEDAAEYKARIQDDIIVRAISLLEERLNTYDRGTDYTCPGDVKDYLFLKLAEEPAEKFCVMFLDNRHRMIAFEEMFHGTVSSASVHPREVVRAVIKHNAAAVILAHNHPSGEPEPSRADQQITKRLVDTLALVDCRVLDALVVGNVRAEIVSFAERGLL